MRPSPPRQEEYSGEGDRASRLDAYLCDTQPFRPANNNAEIRSRPRLERRKSLFERAAAKIRTAASGRLKSHGISTACRRQPDSTRGGRSAKIPLTMLFLRNGLARLDKKEPVVHRNMSRIALRSPPQDWGWSHAFTGRRRSPTSDVPASAGRRRYETIEQAEIAAMI